MDFYKTFLTKKPPHPHLGEITTQKVIVGKMVSEWKEEPRPAAVTYALLSLKSRGDLHIGRLQNQISKINVPSQS